MRSGLSAITSDSFTYTISSNTGGTATAATANGTANLTLVGRVWYVRNNGAGGNGQSQSSFNLLSSAISASTASDFIFVYRGDGTTLNLTGAATLKASQSLIGEGVALTVNGNNLVAAGSLPLIGGTVTMHDNTTVRGLNISVTSTNKGLVSATHPGLVVNNIPTITAVNAAAVDFSNSSGTFAFNDIVTSSGTGQGVIFASTTSASTVPFNNITTASGAAFTTSSTGTTDFTVNDVTSTTGTAVSITTSTGDYVFHKITKNGGATGIDVSGATGTFTVNGDSTTAGTGGTIQNTTSHGAKFVGSNNITLKNMNLTNDAQTQSVTGASSSCGGDLATGNNLSCVAGLFLQTTTTVVLNNLSVTGSNQQGINGNATNGLTITNSTITGNGDESFEDGILLQNASGTIGITGSTIKDNEARQMHIGNLSGTMTLNTSTSTYGRTANGNANTQQGILLQLMGTSNSTINATTLTMNNSFGTVATNAFQLNADTGGPTVNGSITSSSFDNYAAAVFVNAGGTANVTFNTMNNATMTKTALQAINYTILGGDPAITAKITGTISGNTMNGCLPVGSNCHGIDLNMGTNHNGELHLLIDNNNIQNTAGGVTLLADGATNPGTAKAHLKIIRNSISNPVPTLAIRAGIELQAALSSPAGANISLCTDVGGAGVQNTITGDWGNNSSDSGIFLRQRFSASNSWILPGYGGLNNDSAAVQTYINGRNTISGAVFQSTASTTTGAFTNGSCTTPLLLGAGGVESLPWSLASAARYDLPFDFTAAPDNGGAANVFASPLSSVDSSLGQKQLDGIVAAAIERWSATGLTTQQVAILRGLQFDVADLDGIYLGEASGANIQIDRNAGGKGWFTGADSSSDLLFGRAVSNTRRYTDPLSAPAGHLDLLTAIEHEMGHKLGLGDSYDEKDRDKLMYGYLTVGERRLPAKGEAGNARPGSHGTQHLKLRELAAQPALTIKPAKPLTPLSGETVNQSIGTLPAGKSVTITFQVTLNASMPVGTSTVTTQGTVTYSGGALIVNPDSSDPSLAPDLTVLTDDPDIGSNGAGETDPTVTPIDAPTATGSSVSGQILDTNGNPVEGAAVRMSGTQNRLTVTDATGFYHFDDVETGGFYTVIPARSNFTFSPSQRAFSQLGQNTDAVFVGNTTGTSLNPLDTTEYFVRQQYVDFLGREPDEAGLGFWVNNIESCGESALCRQAKRTDTSAAFFLSIEFQQTGYLVYRTYQAAFGDMAGAPVPIKLGEFKPDTAAVAKDVIVNATGWETTLDNNKLAFMAEFVSRAKFVSAYPTSLSPDAFVDQLFAHAGVTPVAGDRTAAINEFGAATTTADTAARGRALRRVAENTQLAQQEFTQAFVLMQYFGYLRRDPNTGQDTDYSGYSFWLGKLNGFNGNFGDAEMVKSFLVSTEYRERFPK